MFCFRAGNPAPLSRGWGAKIETNVMRHKLRRNYTSGHSKFFCRKFDEDHVCTTQQNTTPHTHNKDRPGKQAQGQTQAETTKTKEETETRTFEDIFGHWRRSAHKNENEIAAISPPLYVYLNTQYTHSSARSTYATKHTILTSACSALRNLLVRPDMMHTSEFVDQHAKRASKNTNLAMHGERRRRAMRGFAASLTTKLQKAHVMDF